MTKLEHLERIKKKCISSLTLAAFLDGDVANTKPAEAGWRSTIAAIEFLERTEMYSTTLADEIIAAWPEELL